MDEALWLPTEKSVAIALRTQQIIANESGVTDSVDPLAGSYMVEYLTDEIEKRRVSTLRKLMNWAAHWLPLKMVFCSMKFRNQRTASKNPLKTANRSSLD